ncbi:MAG: hypothetical protein JJ920_00590 [Roseitalea sp.]|jgi:uncharacterized membrane protein|nr:hypothetical protein [Roseitalea sp.]MBO6741375.1 hypothetical protein [Roseitalea sp.]
MREAFHALLPDFGDDAVLPPVGQPAVASATAPPEDAFVPLLGPAGRGAPFDNLKTDMVEPAPPPRPAETGAPGDAAALQSMLSEAFSAEPSPAVAATIHADPDIGAVPPAGPDVAPEPDVQARPVDQGPELAARDAQINELTERIEALESAHAAEIARLAEQAVPAMADGVAAAIKSALGAVLVHPLMAVIEEQAVDRFCADLAAMVKAGEGVCVHLSGPESLLQAVRERWSDGLAQPEMEVAEVTDLVAVADTAVLSTRLEEARTLLFGGGR